MPDTILPALASLAPAQLADLLYAVRGGNTDGNLTTADLLALGYEVPLVYNPNMEVSQRRQFSTMMLTNTPQYGPDRWACVMSGAAAGQTYVNTGGVTTGVRRGLLLQRANGSSSLGQLATLQAIPTEDCVPLQGRTVSMRMVGWRGSGFSAAGATVNVYVYASTGTDQSVNTLYNGTWAGQTPILISNIVLPTTNYTFFPNVGTFTVPTNAMQIGIYIFWTPTGTADGNDWVTITNVDIRPFNAPSFAPRLPSTLELLRCMQFYEKSYPAQYTPGALVVPSHSSTAFHTNYAPGFAFKVRKRATPTVTLYSRNGTSGKVSSFLTGADVGTVVTAATVSDYGCRNIEDSGAGFTVGTNYEYHYTADAEL